MLFDDYLRSFLNQKKEEGNFRKLDILFNEENLPKRQNSDHILNFLDNDYLSLRDDKAIKKKLIKKIKKYPLSASSSRLLYKGNLFENLERNLATAFKKEACLVFPSGFQLNQSVLRAILDKITIGERLIFCDKNNHSSIYEGIDFKKNDKLFRYENCNLDKLEELLEKHKDFKNKFVLTESLFSMDGSILNFKKIIELKKKYSFFLFVDDCHATGIFGKNGYGLCEDYSEDIDLITGSLSKAIPSQGAFVVCSQVIKDYLVNTCKGFIYSSSLSLSSLFVAEIFFENIHLYEKKRQKLLKNCLFFVNSLKNIIKKKNLDIKEHNYHISPIVPIIFGDNKKLEKCYNFCLKNNILTSAIKSPTVKKGTERIRVSIKSDFSYRQLKKFLNILEKI